ncbi:MAG: ABC transporter permease [Candidatus Rokubacteria bacterium]|nr:ABC transporter permease [Candidatus Rokubacteria bacterium]
MRHPGVVRPILGTVCSFGLAALVWESFARSGLFAPALTPSVVAIGAALGRMLLDGTLLRHVLYTLYRILAGLALAAAVGLPIGMLMGRFRHVERFFIPLVSVLSPIPSLAWVPVFILWFGLGNTAAIALVFYAATFPIILNAWTGVRSVSRLWIRAAEAMGADERVLFQKVVLPGSMPFVITGLRQAFARSWIAVVGGEMIAATSWGLGWVIFDSKEFLNADVMMASLVVIGILGLAFERLIFQAIERRTVGLWGMVKAVAG